MHRKSRTNLNVQVAIPVYAVLVIVSAVLYRVMVTTLHAPLQAGREGLLHQTGEILAGPAAAGAMVRIHGELWRVASSDRLKPRDLVEVTGTQGLTLRVRKKRIRG